MQIRPSGSRRLVVLAMAASSILAAQELKFGIDAAVAAPTDELKPLVDNKTGYTLGFFALTDLGSGHVLRPRVGYYQTTLSSSYVGPLAFPDGLGSFSLAEHGRVSCWSLGVDYLRYLRDFPNRGGYFLAGAGGSSNRYQIALNEVLATGTGTEQATAQSTKLFVELGFGYQLNSSLGLELAYRRTLLGGQPLLISASATSAKGTATLQSISSVPSMVLGYVDMGLTLRF